MAHGHATSSARATDVPAPVCGVQAFAASEPHWRVAASKAVLDTGADCVIVFDRLLRIVHFTAGGLHAPRDGRRRNLVGKAIDTLPMFASAEMRRAAAEAVGGRRSVGRFKLTLGRDGRAAHFDVRFGPVLDPYGRVDGATAVLRDVTRQHDTEEALRQAQRSEALGQIAMGVVHDLNNLLTIVVARLELLSRSDYDRKQQARAISDASAAAERGMDMLRRLLVVGRRGASVRQSLDAVQVINEISDLLRQVLMPAIELEVRGASGLGAAWGDRGQLESAVLNLVLNAREAIAGCGKVTIETAAAARGERNFVAIAVRDTGCGMPDDVRRRAFEPFFSTKPVGHGTGLGLMMVERFAREAGGFVELETEPGQGTCVRLLLPCAE